MKPEGPPLRPEGSEPTDRYASSNLLLLLPLPMPGTAVAAVAAVTAPLPLVAAALAAPELPYRPGRDPVAAAAMLPLPLPPPAPPLPTLKPDRIVVLVPLMFKADGLAAPSPRVGVWLGVWEVWGA